MQVVSVSEFTHADFQGKAELTIPALFARYSRKALERSRKRLREEATEEAGTQYLIWGRVQE